MIARIQLKEKPQYGIGNCVDGLVILALDGGLGIK
jgi:hypothetical protein